jgi:hypothetical protein
MKGILNLKPGGSARLYLPNIVITAIVPCFTVNNDKAIRTITSAITIIIGSII